MSVFKAFIWLKKALWLWKWINGINSVFLGIEITLRRTEKPAYFSPLLDFFYGKVPNMVYFTLNFFFKSPLNRPFVKVDYTIKKFNKGLKLIRYLKMLSINYTIKKFNKGLKHIIITKFSLKYYTIKKFNKGLKL